MRVCGVYNDDATTTRRRRRSVSTSPSALALAAAAAAAAATLPSVTTAVASPSAGGAGAGPRHQQQYQHCSSGGRLQQWRGTRGATRSSSAAQAAARFSQRSDASISWRRVRVRVRPAGAGASPQPQHHPWQPTSQLDACVNPRMNEWSYQQVSWSTPRCRSACAGEGGPSTRELNALNPSYPPGHRTQINPTKDQPTTPSTSKAKDETSPSASIVELTSSATHTGRRNTRSQPAIDSLQGSWAHLSKGRNWLSASTAAVQSLSLGRWKQEKQGGAEGTTVAVSAVVRDHWPAAPVVCRHPTGTSAGCPHSHVVRKHNLACSLSAVCFPTFLLLLIGQEVTLEARDVRPSLFQLHAVFCKRLLRTSNFDGPTLSVQPPQRQQNSSSKKCWDVN